MVFFRNLLTALRAGMLLTWLILLLLELRAPRSVSDFLSPHVFLILGLGLFFIPERQPLARAAKITFALLAIVGVVYFLALEPGLGPLSRFALGLLGAAVAIYIANEYL